MENLATEFKGKLAQNLCYGQYFDIDVKTINSPKSFHISLAEKKLNEHPDADIGLHVLVRLDVNQISLNSRSGDSWAAAVTAKCKALDFPMTDAAFSVNIHLCETSFNVALNGRHMLQMFYRSMDPLSAIQVGGDVKLITRVDHRQTYPTLWPPTSSPAGQFYSYDIPMRLQPGHLMVMTGRCYGPANAQFAVNVKHAYNPTQMLHFNPRFKMGQVVRNSMVPTANEVYIYGPEELDGGFPFDFHKAFRLGIGCRELDFVIAVNGSYFCTFSYRDPCKSDLSSMVGLKVTGPIKITELDHIQCGSSDCANIEKFTKF